MWISLRDKKGGIDRVANPWNTREKRRVESVCDDEESRRGAEKKRA